MNRPSNRIKIGFLTSTDPRDRRSWSGTHYHIAQALQKHCGDVYLLGPVRSKLQLIYYLFFRFSLLFKKYYSYTDSIFLAKRHAEIVSRKISGHSFDILFASAAPTEIAFLDTKISIVYLADVTFSLLINHYPAYSNILNISIREGNLVEKLAIKKAGALLYPTEWAAQSAINDYHADRGKIHILPFGANLENIPPAEKIQKKRKADTCRLLFLATDWYRKGGDIAFDTLMNLEALGVPAELIVCGCIPPRRFFHPKITVIPFLDKNDDRKRMELAELLLTSNFLLLPTKAECYGIVFCEANAFGLPVITTNTGGVSGIIENGRNGYMLPLGAQGSQYAELIAGLYQDDRSYYKLVRSSRRMFDEKLNWDTWARQAKKIIAQLL